jgi:hypothetical protein
MLFNPKFSHSGEARLPEFIAWFDLNPIPCLVYKAAPFVPA